MACLVVAVGAGCGATGSQSDLSTDHGYFNRLDPKLLVLSPSDVGAGYAQNAPATHPIPLQQTIATIGRRMRREYVAGYAAGYPATSANQWPLGIWCAAQVYETNLGGWYATAAIRYSHNYPRGQLQVPQDAPGIPLALAVKPRTNLGGYTAKLVVYLWVEGRVSSAITVSGRPGDPTKPLVAALMRLAKIQDTKIRMAS
jgi:hypothetical protein